MKKNRLLTLLLGLLLLPVLIAACAASLLTPVRSATTPPPVATATPPLQMDVPKLRIKNTGTQDIKNLTVQFPESRITFGDIPAGSTTDYQTAPKGVFNYAAYEYILNGETVSQPVLDWVGESPRPGASYTYVISFDPQNEQLQRIVLEEVTVP